MEVGEGVAQRVFVDRRRGTGALDNLAEQAAHSDPSLQAAALPGAAGPRTFRAAESNRLQGSSGSGAAPRLPQPHNIAFHIREPGKRS